VHRDAMSPRRLDTGARRRRGFTLLEVLVALLLMSLALVALIRLTTLEAQASAHLRDTTLAQWVAANALAETRLDTPFPEAGRREGESSMGGQRWRWRIDIAGTDDPGVRRLDVRVMRAGEGDDAPVVTTLSGFASQ
jgi:general secretion pathway protein I